MRFRHEYKHNINYSDLLILKSRLGHILPHDRYSGEDGTYFVKSLYFDNYRDKALREKLDGVDKREKFRIRYYGNDTSFIRLEKKSKISGLCNKVSAMITAEQCEKIINGDTDFLLQSGNGENIGFENMSLEVSADAENSAEAPDAETAPDAVASASVQMPDNAGGNFPQMNVNFPQFNGGEQGNFQQNGGGAGQGGGMFGGMPGGDFVGGRNGTQNVEPEAPKTFMDIVKENATPIFSVVLLGVAFVFVIFYKRKSF